MKSLLGWLFLSLLFLIGGVMFAQRKPLPAIGDIKLSGEVIQAEAAPFDRLDAICVLAGRCEMASAIRVQPMILTLSVVGLHNGILELNIEKEQRKDGSLGYAVHELEQYRIPLRHTDLQRMDRTKDYPTLTPTVGCHPLQIATFMTQDLVGMIHCSTTDLLAGETHDNGTVSGLELFFTSQEACEGARQAIIDLANEAMQEPKPATPTGRIGQD